MRFMLIVKASAESEAGVMPTERELMEMGKFNERMVDAGVMLAGDGLHPSSKAARVDFRDGRPIVTDGPFAEAKELIAGYWIIQADSLKDAIEWARQVPFHDGQVEVRQIFELSDFEPGEAIEQHAKLAEKMSKR